MFLLRWVGAIALILFVAIMIMLQVQIVELSCLEPYRETNHGACCRMGKKCLIYDFDFTYYDGGIPMIYTLENVR